MTLQIQAPPDRLRYLLELQRRAAKIKPGVARYYDDPLAFAHDCIDWRGERRPDRLPGGHPRRRCLSGSARRSEGLTGSASRSTAAVAVLWFALTRDAAGVDWKVATTAGSWHQLTQYLWPEIHKWAGKLRWDKVRDGRPFSRAELQNLNLKLGHGARVRRRVGERGADRGRARRFAAVRLRRGEGDPRRHVRRVRGRVLRGR